MNPVVHFDGIEANYINKDRLERTIRLVPLEPAKSCSYGELLNGLCNGVVQPDEINGIFRVSPTDSSYSVLFRFSDTVDEVVKLKQIKAGSCVFDVMKMTEQVLNLRIHWLPIYFDNSILSEILSQYGEILDIKMLKTAHEKLVAYNGVREVRLKTDEFHKQQIPHIVNFNSGQSILITMQGRPPFCLKCKGIGHVRQRCPTSRSFAEAVERVADPAPTPAPAPEASSAPPSGSSDPEVGANPPSGGADSSGEGPSDQEQQLPMDEQTDSSLKRGWESEDDGAWITPNRTARPRSVSPDPMILNPGFNPKYRPGK